VRSLTVAVVLVCATLPPATSSAQARAASKDTEKKDGEYSTVVRGQRNKPRDESTATSTIPGAVLRESARPSLVEAVAQEAPWVQVTSRGAGLHGIGQGASGAIRMRGLGGSPNTQVLVVQDGVPDYQGIFGHPMPDTYVPDLLESVQVIPGGDSVLYGTNALGGVIQLHSRWRREPGLEAHLKAGYGSFGTLLVQPAVLGRWRSWDAVASFHQERSGGHRQGAGGTVEGGQLGARVMLGSWARLTVRGRVAHLHGWDPGPVTHPYADHTFDALRGGGSVTFEHLHDRLSGRAVLFASVGRHELYDGFRSLDVTDGAILEENWRPHRTVELLGGLSLDHVDGKVSNRISGEVQKVSALFTAAPYQQVSFRPFRRWLLTAGAREVISPTYGFVFLWKAGSTLALWRGARLRARYATNFRQPTIRERYLPYPVANPGLRPERSASLEGGLSQRVGRHLEGELTVFRTDAQDLIKTFGNWPAAEVVNIDRVVFWGVEALVRLRAVGPFSFTFGGTALRVGRYTKQNPSAKLDGSLSFDRGPVHAALTGQWVSGLTMNDYGRDPIGDVFFLDLEGRYRLPRFHVDVFLILRNLTNRENAFLAGYPLPRFHAFGGLEVHL
jgi:outer membrane cobalamin receptor